jgi:hypothetical protein
MNQKIKTALSVAACSGTAFVVGCASTLPPPNDQWAAAQADVGRAQEAGASTVLASVEAQLALSLAKQASAQDRAVKAQAELQAPAAAPPR